MNPEIFAEFLARQGHRIVKTESCYWYNAQPGFYFYFPYHRLIDPTADELKRILWGERCIGIRFFVPMDGIGKDSYSIVCSDKNYDLPSLESKSRNQTRRGLENFEIKQIAIKDLVKPGHPLNIDTFTRQRRNPNTWSKYKWKHYCDSMEGLDGFEAWGAFTEGKLASFIMGFQMEDHFTFLHQSSSTEYLRLYPNNALAFTVTKLKLALPEVATVSYGPQSLDAPESLDTFKFNLGYQKQLMKQKIVFNPLIQPFVGSVLQMIVQTAARARPQSNTLRKTEGIIRFYREAT